MTNPSEKKDRNDRSRENNEIKIVDHEWDPSVEPSTAIVEAIATATEQDPLKMQPLAEYIDVDALDTLLKSVTRESDIVRIAFQYGDLHVVVTSTGRISIHTDEASTNTETVT